MERTRRARLVDPFFAGAHTVLATLILLLIAFFLTRLFIEAQPALHESGYIGFVFNNDWDVSRGVYGAWPLVVGTILTSAIAVIIGVPLAISAAIYTTELAPHRLRGTLVVAIELLAAVPSVVYGLWGIFFLAPKLLPAQQWFSDTFSFLPLVGGPVSIPNCFVAGLIMAIMILPIVCAISRESMATVPAHDKEAALALGATRWEMIRLAVLPYSRAGITGGAMLGLGRALGETIAVTIVIGNAPNVPETIFSQGYTLAAVIANEFGEAASDPAHRAALIAAGLVLFVITLIVNGLARYFISGTRRGVADLARGA
jgi:phosphate ABC transporter permease protein PstC